MSCVGCIYEGGCARCEECENESLLVSNQWEIDAQGLIDAM